MSESRHVWNLVKRNMPGRWERVENHIMEGFPDCAGVRGGNTQLMELKRLVHEPEAQTRLGMSVHQHVFLFTWPCWLLARIKGRLVLVHGSRAPRSLAPPRDWWGAASAVQNVRGCDWDWMGHLVFGEVRS